MKTIIHKNLLKLLKSKAALVVSGGLILMSCGAYTGGYSETDGVYYDPNTDTLPEGYVNVEGGNKVGDYYNYQDSTSIIQKSKQNEIERKNRYRNDNWYDGKKSPSSDWGTYSGSEMYYNNWGYGYPWGMGRFGMGYGGYFGYNINYGWGSPWGFGFDPFWDYSPWGYNSYFGYYPWGYSPYYFGYNAFYHYNPYGYGYYGAYGYNPYYGYYGSYNNNYYQRLPQRKSGADGSYNNGSTYNRMNQQNNGFRTNNSYQRPVINDSQNPTRSQPRMRATERNSWEPTQRQLPENRTYENRTFENRSNSGGFRGGDSGGFRSGGFNSGSGSSGRVDSGSRSDGGMRSGGRF